MFLPAPRGLADPARLAERRALLDDRTEAQPLRTFADGLAARRRVPVPHPDPADAGVRARVLIVLESPGAMAVRETGQGSGFISVDNDDATAENLWRARDAAGLHQSTTAVWNLIPWHLGPEDRKPTAEEQSAGAAALRAFVDLLPELRVVVLAGTIAQAAWRKDVSDLVSRRPAVLHAPNPSYRGLNQVGARDRLVEALGRAASRL